MKIEDQVCTIQQGHKLRSLGINGAFAHFNHAGYYPDPTGQHEGYTIVMDEYHELCAVSEKIAPAFTVSEMQLMCGNIGNIMISERSDSKGMFYSDIDTMNEDYNLRFEYYRTFAEAWGAKLIRGLEAGFYKTEECNKRLLKP